MSDRRQQTQSLRSSSSNAAGVKGSMLLVDAQLVNNSMPSSAELLEILQGMAASYSAKEASGLPPKLFYFVFQQAQLLVVYARRSMVAVLLSSDADVTPVEEAARKVAATAHMAHAQEQLSAAMQVLFPQEEVVAVDLAVEKPSWQKQKSLLEQIMAKVVNQALATKWVSSELDKLSAPAPEVPTVQRFDDVVRGLTGRIPNRSKRQQLEQEMRMALASC
jgi:hypothetical protein